MGCDHTFRVNDKFVESDFHRQFIEGLALHNLTAQGGEESLLFSPVAVIDDVCYDSSKNRITQKLERWTVAGLSSSQRIMKWFIMVPKRRNPLCLIIG